VLQKKKKIFPPPSDLPPASHHSSKAQYLSVSTIDVSDGPNQAVDYYLCVVLPFICAISSWDSWIM